MNAGSRLGRLGPPSPQLRKRDGETDPIRLRARFGHPLPISDGPERVRCS
jgi:hypothetical protein